MYVHSLLVAPFLGLVLVLFAGTRGKAADQPSQPASKAQAATEALESFRRAWEAQPGPMRKPEDMGWKVRMTTLCQLVKNGTEAVPVLAEALEDKNAEVRVFAAQVLGFLADASIAGKLEQVLEKDPDPAGRLYAADALGMVGGMKPKPPYTKVAEQDANRDVKAHVRFALERQGEPLPPEVQKRFRDFDLEKMDTARVGKPAPDFLVTDALDKTYRLSDFRNKKAVVLVFIYGDT